MMAIKGYNIGQTVLFQQRVDELILENVSAAAVTL